MKESMVTHPRTGGGKDHERRTLGLGPIDGCTPEPHMCLALSRSCSPRVPPASPIPPSIATATAAPRRHPRPHTLYVPACSR